MSDVAVIAISAAAVLLCVLAYSSKKRISLRKKKDAQLSRIGKGQRGDKSSLADGENIKVMRSGGMIYKISTLLDNSLFRAGIRADTGLIALVWTGMVLLLPSLVAVLTKSVLFAVITLVAATALPFAAMSVIEKRRTAKFESQLADAIDVMRSAIRAGHSFQDSLSVVADSSEDPIRSEFRTMFNEISLGTNISDAMSNLSQRVRSRDNEIFCTALLIQASVGGNLIIVLENISGTIRNRIRIKKEIKAKTASGRLSGIIVGALPFFITAFIYATDPEYIDSFIADPAGRLATGAGLLLMITGIAIIRKIVKIEY